jgi:hypothetical protein
VQMHAPILSSPPLPERPKSLSQSAIGHAKIQGLPLQLGFFYFFYFTRFHS